MNTPERNRELLRIAGGPTVVSRLFGISGQAVTGWYSEHVPSERVIPICESVQFRIAPHELRPDIYPHPDDGLPESMRARAAE